MKYILKRLLTVLPVVVLSLGIAHSVRADEDRDSLGHNRVAFLEMVPFNVPTEARLSGSRASRLRIAEELIAMKSDTPSVLRTASYVTSRSVSSGFGGKGIPAESVVSEAPASFSFTVLSPIWQAWWFSALAAIVLLTIGYSGYRSRASRVLELERIRTRIASDLHDDIGATLSQIAIVSEVLGRQVSPADVRVAKNLELIARTSREAVDSMSDIVWAINPEKDNLSNLVRRMRRFSSDVLPAKSIAFRFQAPTEDVRLGAEVRRQVFLTFKECINNLVKHARCTSAEIELRIDTAWLVLEVSDNGCGLVKSETLDGHGLVSMRRRAESLDGLLEVTSDDGGTTVTLRVPRRQAVWFLHESVGTV